MNQILSFLIILSTINTSYLCDSNQLDLIIRNNINGDFAEINKITEIKPGAFVTINWKKINLMLPLSPGTKFLSFSDKKWDWRYTYNKNREINEAEPILYELLESGLYNEYDCKLKVS